MNNTFTHIKILDQTQVRARKKNGFRELGYAWQPLVARVVLTGFLLALPSPDISRRMRSAMAG